MWQSESIRRIVRLGAAVAAAAVAVPPTSASAQEVYELSGDHGAVWNLAGTVNVTGGGSALTVEVRRGGADRGQLEVATGAIALDSDGVGRVEALRILYPGDEIVHPGGNAELHVRDDGTFYLGGGDHGRKVKIREDGSGLDAHADLDIRIPNGKTVLVYLAAGEVVVSRVDGDLTVSAGSADIRSTGTSGRLVLDTGSGDVSVDGARGDVTLDTGSGDVSASNVSGDELTADTGSGDVTLALPASWESRVELDTASGDIHSDFRMTVEEMDDDYARRRVGTGGGSLEVDAGSGDIRLVQN
jgi:ferric-dicitrate binding protein FerR (iron transport regulator)